MTPAPASTPRYSWTKVLDLPRGLRFFREATSGFLAVADRSGDTPDRTDDGVLWVDHDRQLRVNLGELPALSIPVRRNAERGVSTLWTVADIDHAPSVVQLTGLSVRGSQEGWAVAALVAHLNGVAPATRREEGSESLLHLPSHNGIRDLHVYQPTIPGSFPAVGITVGTALYTCGPRAARQVAQALLAAADKAEELKR